MRTVLYIRVSDDEQEKEGFSIEAQESLLKRKAAEWGYTVVDTYIDPAYSAKNMKRPALQKMLKDAKGNQFDVVIFWRLDRFTRNSKDFQKMIEILETHRVSIRSATENIDTTTAFGRFSLELTVSLAQLERETTAERVHFVMEERHQKGLRNGAVAPYGYDLVEGRLAVNAIEKPIVERIFDMYLSNRSCQYIAKQLNKEGIQKRGGKWAEFTVYYIITNPVYCGKLRWNYRKMSGKKTGKEIIVDGDHELIITEEKFERIQQAREFRKDVGKRATSDYAFSGVLKCGRCGYAMIGISRKVKNGRKRSYKCVGRFHYGVCDMPLISEDSVIKTFLEALNMGTEGLTEVSAAAEPEPNEIDSIRNELAQLQKRKKKWQEAFANDVISLEDLKARTMEDKQREEFLTEKLKEMEAPKAAPMTTDEIKGHFQNFHKAWADLEESTRKAFVNELFKHITINTEVTEAVGGPGKYVPVYIQSFGFKE